MLPPDVVEPALGTRRARRMAAQSGGRHCSTSELPEGNTTVLADEPTIETTVGAPALVTPEPTVLASPIATAAAPASPPSAPARRTRREMREAARAATPEVAAPEATVEVAAPRRSRRELRAAALVDQRGQASPAASPEPEVTAPPAPASEQPAWEQPAPPRPGSAFHRPTHDAPLTRRELRRRAELAALANDPEPSAQTSASVQAPEAVPADTCLDAVEVPGQEAAAEQTMEFDLASVAHTLSGLSVVENRPENGDEADRASVLAPPTKPTEISAALPRIPAGTPTSSNRAWVPRLAVLSALSAATVITPIMATAGDGIEEDPAAPLAQNSALDTLVATPQTVGAAADATTEAAPEAEDEQTAQLLAEDQFAEMRSSLSASRAEDRSDVPQCGEPEEVTSNGSLVALESNEYVSLSMPIREGVYRETSSFGPRWGSTHLGHDFAAPAGTPIHAIAEGTVTYAGGGKEGRSGMLVIIESEIDGETVEAWYIHMYPDGVFVQEGDTVQVGDVIGAVGSYGNSTGPHLHLEIHTGNVSDSVASAVDPKQWLTSHEATPVTSDVVCN